MPTAKQIADDICEEYRRIIMQPPDKQGRKEKTLTQLIAQAILKDRKEQKKLR